MERRRPVGPDDRRAPLSGRRIRRPRREGHQDPRRSPRRARPSVADALAAHRRRHDEIAAAADGPLTGDGFVFTDHLDGTVPWYPDSVSRRFRVLCKREGLAGVRLHDLRHFVASQLLSAGAEVRTVAGRLGYRNAATTLDIDAHVLEQRDRDAAELMTSSSRVGEATGQHRVDVVPQDDDPPPETSRRDLTASHAFVRGRSGDADELGELRHRVGPPTVRGCGRACNSCGSHRASWCRSQLPPKLPRVLPRIEKFTPVVAPAWLHDGAPPGSAVEPVVPCPALGDADEALRSRR